MKLLLLCEAPMSINAGGISQTLYNIFSNWEPQKLLCISPQKDIDDYPPSNPFQNSYVGYNFEIVKPLKNRLAKYCGKYIDWLNFSTNRLRSFESLRRKIQTFNPDIVVSCPNGPVGVFMHQKLLTRLIAPERIYPYFMDDWMYTNKLKWYGGNLHHSIQQLLKQHPSWLVISRNLATIFEERYDISPKRILEIHNPVDLSNAPQVLPSTNKKEYKLVYAGALWPMHFDSFFSFAKSVKQLNDIMKISIIVHTTETFWKWRKKELEPLGVSYGGNIPYCNIHEHLAGADALILVSSFLKDYHTHSKGSVQTKITDYLKAKRLIISCGPDYSANHSFLKTNNCGVCIETGDYYQIGAELKKILENLENYQHMVDNGWKLLEREFTFSVVHTRFKDFIDQSFRA